MKIPNISISVKQKMIFQIWVQILKIIERECFRSICFLLPYLGYCFSASLPPMLAASSLKAVNMMSDNPGMFNELRERCETVHDAFEGLEGLELHGDRLSPVKHLRIIESRRKSIDEDKKLLRKIVLEVS